MKKQFLSVVACAVDVMSLAWAVESHGLVTDTVIKGKLVVEKDAAGAVKSVSIKTADGKTVPVTLDDRGKEIQVMDQKGVFVTGTQSGSMFTIKTWFMCTECAP